MKLFHKLLVAPATLGLLAPFTAVANEINVNGITSYGIDQEELIEQEFDSNTFSNELAQTNNFLPTNSLAEPNFEAGSFSETTVASFSADFLVGGVEGDERTVLDDEAVTANYSFEIGLNTTFSGEDELEVVIGSGNTPSAHALTGMLDFGNGNADALKVKDLHYTRPFGEKLTLSVGDSMDISKQYSGACAYSGFTDALADCGTGSSAGAGGDVSLAAGLDLGSGFTFGAGLSSSDGSTTKGIFTKESSDLLGFQVAYGADNYGAAVSYASSDTTSTDTTYWGINGYYSFDNALLSDVSVGYEVANPSAGKDSKGYFIGLTTGEIGPGSVSIGMGTNNDVGATTLIVDDAKTLMLYEASYGWDINDGMSATVGAFLQERDTRAGEGDQLVGVALSTSFAF